MHIVLLPKEKNQDKDKLRWEEGVNKTEWRCLDVSSAAFCNQAPPFGKKPSVGGSEIKKGLACRSNQCQPSPVIIKLWMWPAGREKKTRVRARAGHVTSDSAERKICEYLGWSGSSVAILTKREAASRTRKERLALWSMKRVFLNYPPFPQIRTFSPSSLRFRMTDKRTKGDFLFRRSKENCQFSKWTLFLSIRQRRREWRQ